MDNTIRKEQFSTKTKRKWVAIKTNSVYYLLFFPAFAVLFVFNILPLCGLIVAFKDYNAFDGIFLSPFKDPWYGNFATLFAESYFWTTLRNTLIISFLKLLICFPAPIFMALIFNEVKIKSFKRGIQTILYLPHFLSWVILGGIFQQILASGAEVGMVNKFFTTLGLKQVEFFTNGKSFVVFLILSDMWQNVGFASILYLAAIASSDNSPVEAAKLDGANRWQVMWYVTMPVLIPTIVLQLILQIAKILDGGFGQVRNTYNSYVYDYGDIIDTYIYRTGIKESGDFGLSAAFGFFKSFIGFILVMITNFISDKLTGEGIL